MHTDVGCINNMLKDTYKWTWINIIQNISKIIDLACFIKRNRQIGEKTPEDWDSVKILQCLQNETYL